MQNENPKIPRKFYSKAFIPVLESKHRYLVCYGSRGCFAKKTKVVTNRGLKKISNVKIGDVVKSYNQETKQIEFKEVTNTFKYQNNDKCIKINYDNQIIICTLDHKFFYKGEFVEIAKILKDNGISIT